MARTFTHDFTKDDGTPVTVKYEVEGSYSPTTYSPHIGACGGDAPVISIIKVWPNTPEHDALRKRMMDIEYPPQDWQKADILLMDADTRQELHELQTKIEADETACALTDAERERMEAWLIENYVEDEPDDPF